MRVCPECKNRFEDAVDRCPHDGTVLVELSDKDGTVMVERQELQRLQALEVGRSRYTIIERIGQGGWGGVYRAYQHSTRREVALKVLRRDVAEDISARRRFHREAEAISRLKHPNTVTIFDFGETPDGLLFIAMEYVEGTSLDQAIRRDGTIAPLRAASIARQVALSLAEAHAKGIVHRDIKPQNIMLAAHEDGQEIVKVLDFGVAKIVGSDTRLTSTGSTFGTPEYMSPEQVQSRDLDHRSDLYSLGIVLYEMLTGAPPFSGNSAVTVALSHVRTRPPPIKGPLDMPESLASLTRRLLAKQPSERGGAAADVARDLEAIELELKTGALPPRRPGRVLRRFLAGAVAHWAAGVTVLAVVCAISAAFLVMRERLRERKAAEGREVAAAAGPSGREEAAREVGGERSLEAPQEGGGGERSLEAPQEGGGGERSLETPQEGGGTAGKEGKGEGTGQGKGGGIAGEEGKGEGTGQGTGDGQGKGGGEGEAKGEANGGEKGGERSLDTPQEGGGTAGKEVKGGGTGLGKGEKGDGTTLPGRLLEVEVTASGGPAEVTVGGDLSCRTPCRLTGQEGEERRVKVERKGFRPRELTIRFGRDQVLEVTLHPIPLSAEDELKVDGEPLKADGLK